jgi:hypothetical protein
MNGFGTRSNSMTGNSPLTSSTIFMGAFERLGHAHPTLENTSLPDMIASVTDQPFSELKSAVEAKDDTAFAKAYADLTDACNSCHQALNHGTVVIGAPDGASSSDLKAVTSRRP